MGLTLLLMTAQEQKSTYTFEEYLELEKDTQERWEYYCGEVFAMAGRTKHHNRLVGNFRRGLEDNLQTKNCQVFSENVKLELTNGKQYVYPDIMLTCDEQDLKDDTESLIRYPSIVVEVLSETTEAYDQGGKKLAYFGLESLLYYVLVWQTANTVEVYERQDAFWHYRNYASKEALIEFPLLGFSMPMSKIYR